MSYFLLISTRIMERKYQCELGIMALGILALGIMALGILALGKMTLGKLSCNRLIAHQAQDLDFKLSCVYSLSIKFFQS